MPDVKLLTAQKEIKSPSRRLNELLGELNLNVQAHEPSIIWVDYPSHPPVREGCDLRSVY